MTRPGRQLEDDDGGEQPVAAVEPRAYPLDHGPGYALLPRTAASFEPLMHERNGLLARAYLVILSRARHAAGWAHGSHGNVWLERGQCIVGERDLADRLAVSKHAGARALRELANLGLIVREAGRRGSVVSLPNYGAFGDFTPAPLGSPMGSMMGSPMGTSVTSSLGSAMGVTNGGTGERENGVRDAHAGGPMGEGRAGTPDPFTGLYEHWRQACERYSPGEIRDPGPMAGRHRVQEALNHPELRQAGTGAIKHALNMLAIQAMAKRDAGEQNPSWPLRKAWSPAVMADALDIPDEQTARERAIRPRAAAPQPEPEKPRKFKQLGDPPPDTAYTGGRVDLNTGQAKPGEPLPSLLAMVDREPQP